MLSGVINAALVVQAILFKFFLRVLRRRDAEDNRKCSVAAVQRANAADKAVVERFIFLVAILLALNRFVVGCAGRMGTDLPAIGPEVVMCLIGNLLLHQAKTAHHRAPHSRFKACVDA